MKNADPRASVVMAVKSGDDSLQQFPTEAITAPRPAASGADVGQAPWPVALPLDVTGARRSRGLAMAAVLGIAIGAALADDGGYSWARQVAATGGNRSAAEVSLPRTLARQRIDRDIPLDSSGGDVTPASAVLPKTTTTRHLKRVEPTRAQPPRALRLAVRGGAFSPSFAAAGTALFFHAGLHEGHLLEVNVDDEGRPSKMVTVLEAPARGFHPRVSPDERQLAFDSNRDGERGVYVADRDGANARRVSGAGFAAVPSWSPDMKWLAFVRAEPDRPKVWNLWLRNMESGELQRLTSYRVGQTWAASWFPDGHRLCYSHEDQLMVADIRTGKIDVFASPRAGRLVRTPAVSPDGGRVLFQVFREGAWMLDLNSGAMRRILDDPTAEEFAWDPGGARVAYHSRKDGEWRIWMTAVPS